MSEVPKGPNSDGTRKRQAEPMERADAKRAKVSTSKPRPQRRSVRLEEKAKRNLIPDLWRVLFEYVPLQDLVRWRQVSREFKWEIEQYFKLQHSLKLFDSSQSVAVYVARLFENHLEDEPHLRMRHIGADDLIVPGRCFTRVLCKMFVRLFPNLDTMVLQMDIDSHWKRDSGSGRRLKTPPLIGNVLHLLELTGVNLVNLALFNLDAWRVDCRSKNDRIVSALNRMHKLRQFHALPSYKASLLPIEPLAPMWARLERLSFNQQQLRAPMPRLGTECKQLMLGPWFTMHMSDSMSALQQLAPQVRANLIRFNYAPTSLRAVPYICDNFIGLESLCISLPLSVNDYCTIDNFFAHFAKLPKLSTLKLEAIRVDTNRWLKCKPKTDAIVHIPPNGTVRRLQLLGINERYDEENFDIKTFCLGIDKLYPNLEEIVIRSIQFEQEYAGANAQAALESKWRVNLVANFLKLKKILIYGDLNELKDILGRHEGLVKFD